MELLKSFGNESLPPSSIKDPFTKTNVNWISVYFIKSNFSPYKWEGTGTVKFQNGDTHGEQKFKGETFDEVVVKIKAMLENLESHE